MQGEKIGDTPQENPGKSSTKKKSTEQKSSRSQPSTANGSNWNVKKVVGGVVGVFCLIIAFAAVVQWKSGTSSHAGVNVHLLCHINPNQCVIKAVLTILIILACFEA